MNKQEETERTKARERELKALHIIINKQVNMERFISLIHNPNCMTYANLYNEGKTGSTSLTKDEFDLIENVYHQIKDEEEIN